MQHCAVPLGWDALVDSPEFRTRFKTGGLGRRRVPGRFEVWMCDLFDACVPGKFVSSGVCVCEGARLLVNAMVMVLCTGVLAVSFSVP